MGAGVQIEYLLFLEIIWATSQQPWEFWWSMLSFILEFMNYVWESMHVEACGSVEVVFFKDISSEKIKNQIKFYRKNY